MLTVVPTSGKALHPDLLGIMLRAYFLSISRVDTGQLINRFNQDLMLIDTTLPLSLFNTSAALFLGVVQLVLIAVASLPALRALPPLFAFLYALQHFYLRTSKQLRSLEFETKAALHTAFSEAAAGIVTVRAHGWTSVIKDKFAERLDRS